MAKGAIKLIIAILVIVGLACLAVYGLTISNMRIPSAFDFEHGIRRGFDLSGGSVIVYEADTSLTKRDPTTEEMSAAKSILRKRLDRLGFTEANVANQGAKRVVVEIPTITNPDEAIKELGQTAELKFTDSDGNTIITGKDVKDAKAQYKPTKPNGPNENYVELTLKPDAVAKWAAATEAAAAKKAQNKNFISISLDTTEISSPRVENKIDSDTCIISGNFTAQSAGDLAQSIKDGQLPFKLNVEERRSAGPILGENALSSSVQAGAIGLIIIFIFMIFFYRLPGLVADIALVAYCAIVILIMSQFRINLSLPGIAGIILSIGMAVDANVIIFERIKDELRMGKTIGASVDSGFKRAVVAVLDSNTTAMIAAVVLFIFGTGPIKGFAITLGLGIIVSLFTAILITHFLLDAIAELNIKSYFLYGYSKKKGGENNV